MVVLAGLVYLPVRVVGAIGVAICLFHNLLDSVPMPEAPVLKTLWAILHVESSVAIGYVHYPLVPWVGVMVRVTRWEACSRWSRVGGTGCSSPSARAWLRCFRASPDQPLWRSRAVDDAVRSSAHADVVHEREEVSAVARLRCLRRLPDARVAGVPGNVRGGFANILQVYGRVPLFFYVLHLALAHFAAGLLAMAMGYGNTRAHQPAAILPAGLGVSLPTVYLAWLLVVVTLYPACRWFGDLKRHRRDWWLSYL